MTVQLDRLAQLVESDFARGLLFLRRAALSADDLEQLSALNASRLHIAERSKIAGLVERVRLATAEANHAAGNRARREP